MQASLRSKGDRPTNARYLNLIIDEAHNILSLESSRESEAWRDYRLETFEEIVKEGRKFGVFLTLASQRPHDISPTIISQLHNYFLHRLVNNLDVLAIEKAVSYLDRVLRTVTHPSKRRLRGRWRISAGAGDREDQPSCTGNGAQQPDDVYRCRLAEALGRSAALSAGFSRSARRRRSTIRPAGVRTLSLEQRRPAVLGLWTHEGSEG